MLIAQILEIENDKRMHRTKRRPLPTGAMSVTKAGVISTLGFISGGALLTSVNVWAAAVGAATWMSYVYIYTPLKTRTIWNTQFGAVVGALPPLLGYAAAVGPTPSIFGL